MDQEILIIGLDEIGASIGLALARAGGKGRRMGYDPDSRLARQARKAGAVERLALSPERSAPEVDLVILSMPPAEVRTYLEALGPRLKRGALVLDTSSLKLEAMRWASEHLPPERYYIGAIPAVSPAALLIGAPGQGEMRPDLFDGGLVAMVIPPRTPEAAVEMALELAACLRAAPFFLDAAEVDGVAAIVEGLPALLGAALIRVALQSPGWREVRRMAGRMFATSAVVGALQPPKTLQETLCLNRDNVLHRLDHLMQELAALRGLIAAGEAEALTQCLAEAVEAHDAWFRARSRAEWGREEQEALELPEGGAFDRVLGIGTHLRPKDRRQS
ncbi:MAG: prephenate dehydrogenase/arogenate dehydrogenase family protein [Chloroflexota bacterium]